MFNLPPILNALRARITLGTAFACCGVASSVALGPAGIIASIFFLPLFAAIVMRDARAAYIQDEPADNRAVVLGWLSRFLGEIEYPTVALVVEIDDFTSLEEVYGGEALQTALTFAQSAIEENLTADDVTFHLDGARFMSALAPTGPMQTEAMLNTCTRIQHALANAPRTTLLPVQLTASISFASSDKIARPTAENVSQAAFATLAEAKRHSPNAVRGHSDAITRRMIAQQQTARDAARAFERGEVFAYFQPQIDLKTGQLSGFEALARWHHRTKGIMSPADFLPAMERAGLMPKLGETMIKQALQALTFWDKAGLHVPRIGVNFSTSELRNPRLVERISTHLDVGNIAPERLTIEVLETVVATDVDDDITGNLAALADLGCGIDLDDFGTGYASIANIRKFSVKRIKIDRSFVNGIDVDDEQRNMVSAILTMADRLGVKALAEGVETRTERDALIELGCGDAQGFQIARPMPIQETVEWANAFFTQTNEPFHLTRRAS